MIGPVGPGAVAGRSVKLLPSGVETPAPLRTNNARALLDEAKTPPVDNARVEALRTAIASGTYRVDSDRLAQAMIDQDLPE